MPNPDRDPIFDEEQAHLSATYAALQELARTLSDKLIELGREAAADKDAMTDELTRNVASESEAMEMHLDFALVNSIVDAYNLSHDLSAEKLRATELLLEQPYFAKVALQYKPGEPARELYIGNAGVSDERYRRLVVDWRSPVAEVYYNQQMGPTSYEANGRTIHVDLQLRRQFDIVRDELRAYFDSDVAIEDSLLLASLSRQRSARMRDITATIQREQNLVVRHEDVPALLVAGIAGSGKTSVLLQRIAYLLYRNRGEVDADNVYLISPNPLFGRYIDGVLPDLGERNPHILTWADLARELLPDGRGLGDAHVSLADLARIDAVIARLAFEQRDFRDVESHGVRIVSAASIWQLSQRFSKAAAGPHRITLMREELLERYEARLKQLAASDEVQDELSTLPLDEQIRLFNGPYIPDGDDDARALALDYLRVRHAGARRAIERDEWVRIDRIGARLLGAGNLAPTAWLYLKMAVTGMGNAEARYVFVDEVQDYPADVVAVLARYFRRAHLLLLGDEHQAIREHTATFDEVRDVLRMLRGGVAECQLLTSYRSTPEITELFSALLPADERGRVQSIQRDEEAPAVVACNGDEARYAVELRGAVQRARAANDGLTAVIVPWKHEAKRVQALLGDDAPQLLGEGDELPAGGVVLITLSLAKGLEFDHVIVPDASARLFPAGDRVAANRLYTTISRATRTIALLSPTEITPLLGR